MCSFAFQSLVWGNFRLTGQQQMATVIIARGGGGDLAFNPVTVVFPMPDDICIDGKHLGTLSYHSAFQVVLPAGHHAFKIRTAFFDDPIKYHGNEIEVDLVAGQTYFFRIKTYPGLIQGHPILVVMEKEHQEKLLKAHPLDFIEKRTMPEK